ncbi:MAG: hypothetical protein IJT19_07450, partial [Bacteroidaceae bacterium]|nr:hypothetical protein [Bacteroidaceae bacterium]
MSRPLGVGVRLNVTEPLPRPSIWSAKSVEFVMPHFCATHMPWSASQPLGVRSLWNGVFFGKPAADCPSVSANGSYHAVAVRG